MNEWGPTSDRERGPKPMAKATHTSISQAQPKDKGMIWMIWLFFEEMS